MITMYVHTYILKHGSIHIYLSRVWCCYEHACLMQSLREPSEVRTVWWHCVIVCAFSLPMHLKVVHTSQLQIHSRNSWNQCSKCMCGHVKNSFVWLSWHACEAIPWKELTIPVIATMQTLPWVMTKTGWSPPHTAIAIDGDKMLWWTYVRCISSQFQFHSINSVVLGACAICAAASRHRVVWCAVPHFLPGSGG